MNFKILRWFASNAVFATLLYLGTVGGIAGAARVVVFASWVFMVVAFLAVKYNNKGITPAVPYSVDVVFDLCIIATMVWNGWAITGVVYALHTLFISIEVAYQKDIARGPYA